MRRRRGRHWLLPMMLWTSLIGRVAPAQTVPLPPALPPGSTDRLATPAPPAPQPIPGPAGMGLPLGGADANVPRGLPINLATAMQLSGVRPLDIATATAQVEQALALQLQAKALWIPNLNAGVNYYRHDGVQQNFFMGPVFPRGRSVSHIVRPFVYHTEVAQLAMSLENRTGGTASWTTSLASVA